MRKQSFSKIKRHPMTLIELFIALSLAMIILTTLSFIYSQINYMNIEMDRTQNESFKRRYVENRLSQALPRSVSSTDKSNDFHFFSSPDLGGLFKPGSESLVFTFDNCVQLNKDMAYHVIGRLYLDTKGNLTLATWPTEKRWKENEDPPMSKEILLEGVETLTFQFYIPPEKGREAGKTNEVIPIGLIGEWADEWRKEYRQLPAMVRVKITRKNDRGKEEKVTFAFTLPHTLKPITYDQ